MKWGFAPPLRGPPLGAGPLDPPPMALRASGGAAAPAPPRGRVRIAGPRRPRTPRNNAGGCVPGPGAARAPPGPLGSSAALRRHQAVCAPVPPVGGPFFAHSAAPFAPGPLPLRGPLRRGAPGAASRARSGPWGPRFARRARPPGLPPGSVARPLVRRCAAPRALAGPVWFGLRHPLRLRAPCSVALAPLRLRRAPARGPAGSPPPRPASRASGAAASGPGGPAAFGRGLVAAPPGALLRARACAGLLVPLSCRCACRGALPCAPPPRRPRWGLRGARGLWPGFAPLPGCAGRVPHGARFSRPTPEPGPRSGRRAAPLFRHG